MEDLLGGGEPPELVVRELEEVVAELLSRKSRIKILIGFSS